MLDGEEREEGGQSRVTESLFEIRCKVEVKLRMRMGRYANLLLVDKSLMRLSFKARLRSSFGHIQHDGLTPRKTVSPSPYVPRILRKTLPPAKTELKCFTLHCRSPSRARLTNPVFSSLCVPFFLSTVHSSQPYLSPFRSKKCGRHTLYCLVLRVPVGSREQVGAIFFWVTTTC